MDQQIRDIYDDSFESYRDGEFLERVFDLIQCRIDDKDGVIYDLNEEIEQQDEKIGELEDEIADSK